ncbi:collagen-like triple helix repeat-containing protein [Cupriavidus basilensis]
MPADARYGAGGVVVNAGETVGALGAGVRDGLGQMGSVHDPVGVTVASTGNVVQKAGDTVTSAGELVSGLGTEKLSPLAPLTTPVGGAVQKLGMAVSHGGDKLGDALSTGPVAQLTGTTSKVIVPLTTKLTGHHAGGGRGDPPGRAGGRLAVKVGYTVAAGGGLLAHSHAPGVSGLGGVFTETGKTVAAAGGLLHGDSYGGSPLGGLLNNVPLAGAGGNMAAATNAPRTC